MPRQLLSLLLPALLLAACGQTPAVVPGATTPGTTTPGTPAQQALPGVFQIDFSGVGTEAPTSHIQTLQPGGLGAQALISAPDQFRFVQRNIQTFANNDTGIRHIRVTYSVTNTSDQILRDPKFVAVVPQGSTTDSVFTNVRYFDGSDATAAIGKLSLVQGQSFDTSTGAVADPKANALLTGLDVSHVDLTGKGIKTLTQTGWWLAAPPAPGGVTFMYPGDSSLITFGVNVPMTPAASGGATKDPFSFSLNVTAVEDASLPVAGAPTPVVSLSSAVKQWNATSQTFGNYVNLPTRTYTENGKALTRSLPAYYDINELNGSTTMKVLCGGDANVRVTNLSTASFPNRWRVQLLSSGEHTLKVVEARSCTASGALLLSQTVTGVQTSATTLAAGRDFSLALLSDGTIQSWGLNNFGQLGDGTSTNRATPGPVIGLSGVMSIAAGDRYGLALRTDGTAWVWGVNGAWGGGDGTTPVPMPGLSDIVSVTAGAGHSLVLRADGTVWSWGTNNSGELGDGTQTDRSTPGMVIGLEGDIVSLAAGNGHSLALLSTGRGFGWGSNAFGQIMPKYSGLLLKTPGFLSYSGGLSRLAGGNYHTMVLQSDGTAWSSGNNMYGQLGVGSTTRVYSPSQVSGLSGMTGLAGGEFYSLAVKADGTVWSWGFNSRGQLGDGTTTNRTLPVLVSGVSGVTSLAAGSTHSLALRSDGTVWSWGESLSGALGDGTTTRRLTPMKVSGLSGVAQPTP